MNPLGHCEVDVVACAVDHALRQADVDLHRLLRQPGALDGGLERVEHARLVAR